MLIVRTPAAKLHPMYCIYMYIGGKSEALILLIVAGITNRRTL